MTIEELRAELALWEQVRSNAAAALAGGDNTGVPGGKPNVNGSNAVDHMGVLREARATIEHLKLQIEQAEAGIVQLTQADC